ncbi:MAG: hypothetical protein H8E37_03515, partial [Planctomycetes bacterium]|nr:hypothetical protein [Planctomycetota bacterium]
MKTLALALSSLAGIIGLASQSALAATRVELVIDEALPNRSVVWPVTTGVPFPRGQLTDEKHCRLIDDTGKEQLLQSKVAATWDAERTSIRWLTIDFLAEPGRKYELEFGPEVERAKIKSPLKIEDNGTGLPPSLLNTGPGPSARINTGELVTSFDLHGELRGAVIRDRIGLWKSVIENGSSVLKDGKPLADSRTGNYYVDGKGVVAE